MRHEIRPGYLLSHALASRLPSSSTEPLLSEGWTHNSNTHNMQRTYMQQTGVCVCVAVIKHVTPAGQYFHTKHVFK